MRTLFGRDGHILPDFAGLMHAIRDQLGDDNVRLALSDFLRDRGDCDRGDEDHAALIQLQCNRARAEPDSLRAVEYFGLEEEDRLLWGTGDRLTAWPGRPGVDFARFVRGLPTAIQVSAPSRLRGARPALAVGTVDTLIVERPGSMQELARQLRGFPFTRLELAVRPGSLPTLLAEADVSGVRGWALRGSPTAPDLTALLNAVRSGRAAVEELSLRGIEHWLDPEEVAELVRGMRAGVLDLTYSNYVCRYIQSLTALPYDRDRGLQRLVADGTGLGDDDLRAIAGWPGAHSLKYLSFKFYGRYTLGPSDSGAEALAGSPYLSALRVLRWGYRLTDRGANALAGAPSGWDLRRIDLRNTQVTAAGVAALRYRFPECWIDCPDGTRS